MVDPRLPCLVIFFLFVIFGGSPLGVCKAARFGMLIVFLKSLLAERGGLWTLSGWAADRSKTHHGSCFLFLGLLLQRLDLLDSSSGARRFLRSKDIDE